MKPLRRRRRWWAWLLVAVAGLVVAALAGFVIWAMTPMGPMPEAGSAMESDDRVTVQQDDLIVFRPAGAAPTTGLIFYPGARVDPVSYAPAMRALAEEGFLAVVVPMPLNLAVLDAGRAADVIGDFPDIQGWAIAGHSLGGAMAAAFAASDPEAVQGLVLWAAYPSAGDDLSSRELLVTSVSASNDGLTTPDDVARAKPLLPAEAEYVVVDGGNHAQFGWYGEQRGDGVATISRADQQDRTVNATLAILLALAATAMPPGR